MPQLKEYNPEKEAKITLETLIAIRGVAEGKMSHLDITQEQAQRYTKYGAAIDKMIELGARLLKDVKKANYLESSPVEEVAVNAAGKSLAVLKAIGVLSTLPYSVIKKEGVSGWAESISNAWNAGEEIANAKKKAIDNYNEAVFGLNKNYEQILSAYAEIGNAIIAQDENKLAIAFDRFAKAMENNVEQLQKVKNAMEEVGFTSTTVAGALDVYKHFLVEVGISLVTMGATDLGVSLGIKAVGKGIQALKGTEEIATATGNIAVAAQRIRKVVKFLEKAEEAKAIKYGKEVAKEVTKAGHEAESASHHAEELHEKLNRNNEAQKELAYSAYGKSQESALQ